MLIYINLFLSFLLNPVFAQESSHCEKFLKQYYSKSDFYGKSWSLKPDGQLTLNDKEGRNEKKDENTVLVFRPNKGFTGMSVATPVKIQTEGGKVSKIQDGLQVFEFGYRNGVCYPHSHNEKKLVGNTISNNVFNFDLCQILDKRNETIESRTAISEKLDELEFPVPKNSRNLKTFKAILKSNDSDLIDKRASEILAECKKSDGISSALADPRLNLPPNRSSAAPNSLETPAASR